MNDSLFRYGILRVAAPAFRFFAVLLLTQFGWTAQGWAHACTPAPTPVDSAVDQWVADVSGSREATDMSTAPPPGSDSSCATRQCSDGVRQNHHIDNILFNNNYGGANAGTTCRFVDNESDNDIFIPQKTWNEFSQFIENAPTGIRFGYCTQAQNYTATASYGDGYKIFGEDGPVAAGPGSPATQTVAFPVARVANTADGSPAQATRHAIFVYTREDCLSDGVTCQPHKIVETQTIQSSVVPSSCTTPNQITGNCDGSWSTPTVVRYFTIDNVSATPLSDYQPPQQSACGHRGFIYDIACGGSQVTSTSNTTGTTSNSASIPVSVPLSGTIGGGGSSGNAAPISSQGNSGASGGSGSAGSGDSSGSTGSGSGSGNGVVNGICGSSNGQTLDSAPTTNLCSSGIVSSVADNGIAWIWTCAGSNGGQTVGCDALVNTSGTSTNSGSGGGSTASAPGTDGPPVAGMVLTFDDEFSTLSASSSGNGTLWETKFFYDNLMQSNGASLDLDPAVCNLGLTPYSISNGILDIHAQTIDPRLTACGVSQAYTGGNLYSYYSFSQQYGYFETRAQASDVRGTWFSFWMIPKDGSWPPEIDMPEILGADPDTDHLSNHTGATNTTITFPVNAGVDLGAGFHTYGVLWDPNNITYYLDGNQVAQTTTGSDENKPFYMIIGLGVGGTCGDGWADCPQNPSAFSADAYVDYVRAWQFSDQNPAACVGDCTAN